MARSFLVVVLLGLASAAPASVLQTPHLSPEDYAFLNSLPVVRASLPAGFKYKYVAHGGAISDTKHGSPLFEVAGSPKTSDKGLYEAALTVSKMIRHMPMDMFTRLANSASVGVFTEAEKLTIYPEYHSMANTPDCQNKCSGTCAHTCTFDGRKYETLAGVGGGRAVIVEDNLLCTPHDAYHHQDNILVHEFSHTINAHAFDAHLKSQLTSAYNNAKAHSLWRLNAYAMANSAEYWGEGTGGFFNVNHQASAGGMNECGGAGHFCNTEAEARTHMQKQDPQLFHILSLTYTGSHPTTASGLTICPR